MAAGTTFLYKGRDSDGRVTKGKLEAVNETAAQSRLLSMGVTPLSVSQAGTGLNREIDLSAIGIGRPTLKDIAVMSRQLATMVAAGLSLLRALRILGQQSENTQLKAAVQQAAADVEQGFSLSDSFAKHPQIFPPLLISMTRAGETGGFLDRALDTIATNFEKESKLRAQIKSAMTYPVVVLIISLIAVIVMLTFIVPIFSQMFAQLGSRLPAPTQVLVDISHQMFWLAPTIIVAALIVAILWSRNRNNPAWRRRIDPVKLRMPVFGTLFKKIAIARFSRNLANMLAAGVPILQSLHVVGETSGNWVIENALSRVALSIRQGRSLAEPLESEPVFPPMVTQMISVGEDSGSLETMLGKIAEFYDAEVEAMTESLTSLIEPLLIAFLGIIVGGMIVCLYLPIFDIINAVQNAS